MNSLVSLQICFVAERSTTEFATKGFCLVVIYFMFSPVY